MTDNQQPSTERTCRKCGLQKPLNEFRPVYSTKNRGKNYFAHTCLVCDRIAHAGRMRKSRKQNPDTYLLHGRKWRSQNLEFARQAKRQSQSRRKELVLMHYGNGECACCKETCRSMLTVDHVNGDGSAHRKTLCGGKSRKDTSVDMYGWLVKNDFPDGFQVLCYNCNISKHRNGNVCEHQLSEGSTTSREAYTQASGKAGRLRKY